MKHILLDHVIRPNCNLHEKWIFLQWNKSVGDEVAKKTLPYRVLGDTLFVNAINSVWVTHLSTLKECLIKELNKNIYPYRIQDIKFKVKYPLRNTIETTEDFKKTLSVNPEEIILNDKEKKKIEEISSEISDDTLRSLISEILNRKEKMKKAKLLSGWKKCAKCTTIVEKDEICPFCKLKKDDQQHH